MNVTKYLFLTVLITFTFPFIISGTSKTVVRAPLAIVNPDKPSSANMAAVQAFLLNDSLHLDTKGLSKQVLEYALKGYNYLEKKGLIYKNPILSICDFSQSSKNKRLYIIDVQNKKLVLNTYVAHGKNSGAEYARSFSNAPESLKSSLGFYLTRNTYSGSHGLSLKIDGLEKGFNDKANKRNIVVHGSDYVGTDFLQANACCGRSYGCPAVPSAESSFVINTIKDGSCLFIYHPTKTYLKKSRILNS
jgi:hypothetical protein